MKEKMLTKLERDRAVGQVQGLQSTIRNMDSIKSGQPASGKSYREKHLKQSQVHFLIREVVAFIISIGFLIMSGQKIFWKFCCTDVDH